MDLSILQTVLPSESISLADYTPPIDYSDPIGIADLGDYSLRVIDGKFKDKENGGVEDAFRLSKTAKGYMQVEVALEILEGKFKGKRLFDRWNQTPFASNPKANMFSNALFGFGFKGTLSQSSDYLKALQQMIVKGATAKAFVSLEWYSNPKAKDYNGTGTSYKAKDLGAPGTILPDGIRLTEPNGTILLGRNVISKYRQ